MSAWLEKLNDNPADWLLNSNPWTKYKSLTDILGYAASDEKLVEAKQELLSDERVISLAN